MVIPESDQVELVIATPSDVLQARHLGRTLAGRAGFRGRALNSVVAAVAVLARILAKGAHGRITLGLTRSGDLTGLSVATHISPIEKSENLNAALVRPLFRALEQMDEVEVATTPVERTLTVTKWRPPFAA